MPSIPKPAQATNDQRGRKSGRSSRPGFPQLIPPQQMTQTATVSLASLGINSTGITLTIAIGDLFGSAVVAIPPPPPPTTVPDVVGGEVTTATRTLEAANLVMYVRAKCPIPM